MKAGDAKWIAICGNPDEGGEFETEAEAREDARHDIEDNGNDVVYVCRVVAVYKRHSTIEIAEVAS